MDISLLNPPKKFDPIWNKAREYLTAMDAAHREPSAIYLHGKQHDALRHWLESKDTSIRDVTFRGYPLLKGNM